LAHGAPCPVYATAETWTRIEHYPIVEQQVVEVGHRFRLGPIMWEPFAVEHSIRAPAVGYRFAFEETVLFYVPDVVMICDQHAALHGVTLYIGDGASIVRPLLRRRGDLTIGHASIRAQLAWCQAEGVTQAMFTHCGSQTVLADERPSPRGSGASGTSMGLLPGLHTMACAAPFHVSQLVRSLITGRRQDRGDILPVSPQRP
jgi:Beta-lactamase superfamily domain